MWYLGGSEVTAMVAIDVAAACGVAAAAGVGLYQLYWHRRRQMAKTKLLRPQEASDVASMPKIELHVHLDGAFDSGLLFGAALKKLAANELTGDAAEAIRACGSSQDAFDALVTCRPDERSLKAMIDKFLLFLPIVQVCMERAIEASIAL